MADDAWCSEIVTAVGAFRGSQSCLEWRPNAAAFTKENKAQQRMRQVDESGPKGRIFYHTNHTDSGHFPTMLIAECVSLMAVAMTRRPFSVR